MKRPEEMHVNELKQRIVTAGTASAATDPFALRVTGVPA